MAHLTYYATGKEAQNNLTNYHFSQAVRIGDKIEISGQTGRNSETGLFPDSPIEQIDQAFRNVYMTLKSAGAEGWQDVYSFRSYHTKLDKEALEAVVRNSRMWCTDHAPLWTCVEVRGLALEEMKVEIEAVAHVPEGRANGLD